MLHRTTASNESSPFFGRSLTLRHFVTSRAFAAGFAGLLLRGIAAFDFWSIGEANGSSAETVVGASSSGEAGSGEVGSVGAARLLPVTAAQFGQLPSPKLVETFTGVVLPRRTSNLAAKAVGRVEQVTVDIGDQVQSGQLLVQLDDYQLKATLKVAKANLASAKDRLAELEAGPRTQEVEQAKSRVSELQANLNLSQERLKRRRKLRESGAVSQQELDESAYEFEAMQAQLRFATEQLNVLEEGTRREQIGAQRNAVAALEAQIEQIEVQVEEQQVIAPYDGTIQRRMIDEGNVVSPGQSLLEFVESSVLEIHVGLPDSVPLAVLDDEVASFTRVDSAGNRYPIEATLERVSPAVDASTRTRRVQFALGADQLSYVGIGDAVELQIEVPGVAGSGIPTIWVPAEAMVSGPRGLWVLYAAVDADGPGQVVEQRPVELLRVQDGMCQVRGPIELNEWFLVEGLHRVVPGQRVQRGRPAEGE
ncbi:MAG: efflux RND transporter periplasmic adaptor subunit [Pirellulaceae bacterium]